MAVDNFDTIKRLLEFASEDEFYHLQIIKRKKEHEELGSNSYIVKTYYIKSLQDLDKENGEIIALCNYHNARACINLNRRSFEAIAFQTLRKVADIIMNKDYKSARKAYNSVCGMHSVEPRKKWIVDIDEEDNGIVEEICGFLCGLEPEIGQYKDYCRLQTKNGWHLITSPFNMQKFKEQYPNIDVHKNNPTILYVP